MTTASVQQIIEQWRQLNRIIRQRTTDPWMTLSLTVPQLRSMFYISRHGKMNISSLASGIKVTPANVTGIVDRLLEKELITRTPDSNDRRVLWLDLTDKGKSLINELREGRSSELKKILENLTPDELSAVTHSYDLLINAAVETTQKKATKDNGFSARSKVKTTSRI